MAKQSGIGALLLVGSADISGDIGAISSIEGSRGVQEVPDITQSAMDRILLRRDGTIAFNAFWDTVTEHPSLSALPTTDQLATIAIGSTVGSPAASMVGKQITYTPALAADGSLGVTANLLANGYGLEWSGGGTGDGILTTGKQSFSTGTVDGTSIDLGDTSTLFGAAGYLHVFSVASGTATFAIQDSADNSSFSDISGLVFTAATGATSQRLQTAAGATIRRYVRLEGRGTHGAAVVLCNFIRYAEAGPV